MTALESRVEDVIHEPTQVHDDRVDLTAAGIFHVSTPGRVDFGGGELEPADLDPVDTELRNPEDDYGWWNLAPGRYLVTFNESVAGDDPLLLQPRRELLERGGTIPTVRTSDLGAVPLDVAAAAGAEVGLRIKENARIATLHEP